MLISNGLFNEFIDQIKQRTNETELLASMKILSKVFEHETSFVKFVFESVGNIIDLLMELLGKAQLPKLKKSCLFILSNIIANSEEFVGYLVNQQFLQVIDKEYHATPFSTIQDEII